jgi:hypothetical protein
VLQVPQLRQHERLQLSDGGDHGVSYTGDPRGFGEAVPSPTTPAP